MELNNFRVAQRNIILRNLTVNKDWALMDSSFSSESGARKGNPCSPTGVPYQLDPRRSFKSNKDRIGQMADSQCFYLTEIKYTKSPKHQI